MFDHFMDVVNSIIKCDKTTKGADSWFNVVRIYLFLEMKEKTTQKVRVRVTEYLYLAEIH